MSVMVTLTLDDETGAYLEHGGRPGPRAGRGGSVERDGRPAL
jgi:hypothetical protein